MEMHEGYHPRPERRGPAAGTVVLLALIFGIIGGFGGTYLAFWADQQQALRQYLPFALPYHTAVATAPTATGVRQTGNQPVAATLNFAPVADELDESVVNINTQSRQMDPFSMFFGNGPQVVKGLGTGVIIDNKGYILTNFHVVGEAQNIVVTVMHTGGKKQYPAKYIGGDKQEDLALIKIDAPNLKPVILGDSDTLRPGEPVMAIGNPFGFEHTVSVGVVSALNRELPVDDAVTLKRMIQTDASINPGNSGGPLVNANGQVVGINSAIFVGGGGQPQANGIGFAIPSNRVQKVMQALRTGQTLKHPFIGISYKFIDDEVRRKERLPVKTGIIISGVLPNGPAAKGGLKESDLVLSVDGKELTEQNTLTDYISNLEVGKMITLDTMRWDEGKSDWARLNVRVKVEDKPAGFEKKMQQQTQPQSGEGEDIAPHNTPDGQPRSLPFPWPF